MKNRISILVLLLIFLFVSNVAAQSDTYYIGSTIERNGRSVTLNSIDITPNLIELNFTIQNTGIEDIKIDSFLSFRAENNGGVALSNDSFSCKNPTIDGKLIPGDTKTGSVCFKTREPSPYKVFYQPGWGASPEDFVWNAVPMPVPPTPIPTATAIPAPTAIPPAAPTAEPTSVPPEIPTIDPQKQQLLNNLEITFPQIFINEANMALPLETRDLGDGKTYKTDYANEIYTERINAPAPLSKSITAGTYINPDLGSYGDFAFRSDITISEVQPEGSNGYCFFVYTNHNLVQGNEFNELVFKLGYGIYTYTYTEAEGGKSNTLIDLSAYKESGKKYHLDIIRQNGVANAFIDGNFIGEVNDGIDGNVSGFIGMTLGTGGQNAACSFDNIEIRTAEKQASLNEPEVKPTESEVPTEKPADFNQIVSSTCLEQNIDRPGLDYRSVSLTKPDPSECSAACVDDVSCIAFTFVSPGILGEEAKCYLKNAMPAPKPMDGVVSGLRANCLSQDAVTLKKQMLQDAAVNFGKTAINKENWGLTDTQTDLGNGNTFITKNEEGMHHIILSAQAPSANRWGNAEQISKDLGTFTDFALHIDIKVNEAQPVKNGGYCWIAYSNNGLTGTKDFKNLYFIPGHKAFSYAFSESKGRESRDLIDLQNYQTIGQNYSVDIIRKDGIANFFIDGQFISEIKDEINENVFMFLGTDLIEGSQYADCAFDNFEIRTFGEPEIVQEEIIEPTEETKEEPENSGSLFDKIIKKPR